MVSQANYWLATNPGFEVLKAETIERNAEFSGDIDYLKSTKFEGAFGNVIYVRGLR